MNPVVSSVVIYGPRHELPDPSSAIAFLETHLMSALPAGLGRCEILVRYSNGDEIRSTFHETRYALELLRSIQ